MEIELDFYSDWIRHLKNTLSKMGYSVTNVSDEKIPIVYFNALRRIIPQKPREVLRSKEFYCDGGLSSAVEEIEKKAKNGENLNPYLSTSLKKADYHDTMLNDWGIHHFHLGSNIDMPGFIERTRPLLFVKVTNTHFYLIAVKNHGDWNCQELVEIIHKNWPEVIKHYKLEIVIGLSHVPSDENIKKLRKVNINTMIKMSDGAIYAPVGGG